RARAGSHECSPRPDRSGRPARPPRRPRGLPGTGGARAVSLDLSSPHGAAAVNRLPCTRRGGPRVAISPSVRSAEASMAHDAHASGTAPAPSDFIRDIVADDVRTGKHRRIVTRFPPEPNGYLHIGHAKAICLNFGIAQEFGGVCHLRFDDTNPLKEDVEYVDSIQEDIRWLGFDWGPTLFYASDYCERLYEFGELLIRDGKAYVDSLSAEEIRTYRGTLTEPGRPSPYRERPADESLDLFRRMRAGEFADG